MIPRSVLKRIRQIEIKTRRVVDSSLTGEYHSVFKGRGLNFAEVREYSQGDDIRFIDWNVTARLGAPFVKLFDEERELVVMLMVDLSASGDFGSDRHTKMAVAAEVAALLGFSAIKNQDRVGLLLFSDKVEAFIPPKKGKRHVFRLLRDIFYVQPESKGTSISVGLEYLMKIYKKKAIVFLISDFMDDHYESSMRLAAKRHDLVPIVIRDGREEQFPSSGVVHLEDSETGETILVNTSSASVREKYQNIVYARELSQDRFFKSVNIRPIRIQAGDSYVKPLVNYFRARSKLR